MPAIQITVPVGLPRAALKQSVEHVKAAADATLGVSPEPLAVWVTEVAADLWSAPGPVVHVAIPDGRPMELLQHLVRQVTDGVAHALAVRPAQVQVIVTVAVPELWGVGRLPVSVVRAEGIAARTRAMS